MEKRNRRPQAQFSPGGGRSHLGGTPVKGTRILGACLGGDAEGGEDERMGRRTKWPGQPLGASQGPQRRYTEGTTTDESAQGPEGSEKRRCHEDELGDGASASASVSSHSSDNE